MAVFTLDKGLTFFDPGNRDEKYLKIMVDTLVIGLVQPADGTAPGVFVKHFRFGGYAEYKKHFWGFNGPGFKGSCSAACSTCIITPKRFILQIRIDCKPVWHSVKSK